jgi:SAM-dependent methyltransferase
MPLSEKLRQRTLERFEHHRRTWDTNPALRALYGEWYARVAEALPPPALGPRVEIGSGPGLARDFIPDLELTDLVRAPWHDREVSADALPFADASLGALVLCDVLHHLPAPRRFFTEASRVLRPGGRIVMCEPYISPLSYPVYKWFHPESLDLRVDPLAEPHENGTRDPFDSNQAIPTLLFGRRREDFEVSFPELVILRVERFAALSYPASGGFSHRAFLPIPLWSALHQLESKLPKLLLRWAAFRMLATMQRR